MKSFNSVGRYLIDYAVIYTVTYTITCARYNVTCSRLITLRYGFVNVFILFSSFKMHPLYSSFRARSRVPLKPLLAPLYTNSLYLSTKILDSSAAFLLQVSNIGNRFSGRKLSRLRVEFFRQRGTANNR